MTRPANRSNPAGEADPLIQALAALARSAVVQRMQLVTWAVENEAELAEPCGCRHQTLQDGCVCNVELGIGARWMRAAAKRVAAGRPPGGPPRRRVCRLCAEGEHDREPTMAIRMVASDGQALGTSWVAVRARRSRKADLQRAERADGLPAGTHDAQLRAADRR